MKFPNPASRYSMVGVFVARTGGGVRVAVTGAGPCAFRWIDAESALAGNFSAGGARWPQASMPSGLNGDIHASAEYRAHLIKVMAKRARRRRRPEHRRGGGTPPPSAAPSGDACWRCWRRRLRSGLRARLPAGPAGGQRMRAAQAVPRPLRRGADACLVPAREFAGQLRGPATLRQDQCRANAQIDYTICQSAYAPTGHCFVGALPDRPSATPSAVAVCEADYRRCFAGCGGTVVEERRCVANCPS